jgi:hypothetical protein
MSNTAGTLVGAVLENAGYIYQAHILDKLGNPLTDTVGALIYLVGIAIVIFQLAILRQSKGAVWLLIGPPLFLACVTVRSEISQARWTFGSHDRDQGKVQSGVTTLVGEGGEGVSTSTLFRRYVEMISPVVSEIVNKVTGSQDKNDMWFLFKGEVFSMLGVRKIENEGLRYLVQYGLLGECHEVFSAARSVTDPLRHVRNSDATQSEGQAGPTDADLQAAKQRFEELLARTVTIRPKPAKKFIASLENEEVASKYSCVEIWRLILKGLAREAEAVERNIDEESERRDLDAAVIKNMIAMADGLQGDKLHSSNAAGFLDVNRLISGYLLRNEIREPSMAGLVGKMINRTETRNQEVRLTGGDNAATEYARIGLDEWSEKERMIHTALSMPYYQGLGLYFLGVVYPFFALLLLIPGKAMGFLNWFMLWLWVKSWDIGFAIVMKIDTLFWGLFVETKARIADAQSADEVMHMDDIFLAIAALDRLDPSFQAGTYYSMIAVCLMSVPVVSAQLVLGASNAGVSIVSEGVSRYADYYATSMRAFVSQDIIHGMKSEALGLQEQAGLSRAASHLISSMRTTESAANESNAGSSLRQGHAGAQAGKAGLINPGSQLGNLERRLSAQGAVSSRRSQMSEAISPYIRAPYPRGDARRMQDENIAKLEQSSYASGAHAPFHFHDRNTYKAMQRIAALVTLGDRRYLSVEAQTELANLSKDLDAEVIDASWQASIEKRAYELHQEIARYGGIPVPWTTPSDEGSIEEFNRHLSRFDQKVKLLRASLGMMSEAAGVAVDTTSDVLQTGRDNNWLNQFSDRPIFSAIDQMYTRLVQGRDGASAASYAYSATVASGLAAGFAIGDLSPSLRSFLSSIVDENGEKSEEEVDKLLEERLSELTPEILQILMHGAPEISFETDPFGVRREHREFGRSLQRYKK